MIEFVVLAAFVVGLVLGAVGTHMRMTRTQPKKKRGGGGAKAAETRRKKAMEAVSDPNKPGQQSVTGGTDPNLYGRKANGEGTWAS